ncbi:MAG: exodeoxyribonuclease VII small subunit [Clostridia bacterium]|nr:exodeoxyribonuclease VII small subunit [Clostridia bacterium]
MKEYKTYEAAKKRLEEIALKLDDKNISLEKSLELYEEGAKLVAVCYDKLNTAELKFSQISVTTAEE